MICATKNVATIDIQTKFFNENLRRIVKHSWLQYYCRQNINAVERKTEHKNSLFFFLEHKYSGNKIEHKHNAQRKLYNSTLLHAFGRWKISHCMS